ncbi:hypothetical protein DUNSADRAFT_15989 [Dunaliella salina]|uniref:Encoded protein n=1 Tax=Dunaliella salina TaxID=3046 RepID=A0ABQ7G4I4_DUNSA|nr:hypothetical protein DUNSADRAFT_15989 [Dunaliella salina]|eukprot:KAF5829494.1 hypothetical protein DUNSADRAFT_15989 [Dunaliella salina]
MANIPGMNLNALPTSTGMPLQMPVGAGFQPEMLANLPGCQSSGAQPACMPTSGPPQVPQGMSSFAQMLSSLAGVNGSTPPACAPPSMTPQVPMGVASQPRVLNSLPGLNSLGAPGVAGTTSAAVQDLQQITKQLESAHHAAQMFLQGQKCSDFQRNGFLTAETY